MNIDMADTAINRSEGAAARAKKALSVADQTRVARVLNPVGERIRVAGSSFMVVRNTSAAPVRSPGLIRGTETWRIELSWLRPSVRAASSMCGLT